MSHFEYQMVPLEEPEHNGDALQGRPEAAIRAMAEHANAFAKAGWEYVRTDTVTTSRRTLWRKVEDTTSVLVFRRRFRVEPMPGMDVTTARAEDRKAFSGPRLAFSQPQPAS